MKNVRFRLDWVVWLLLLSWSCVGVWPVAVLESDGAMIAFGVQQAGKTGAITPESSYRFEAQSGTYMLLRLVEGVFGGDPFVSFALLSALAAVGLAAFSARLVSQLTGVAVPTCGVLVLLFQEAWVSAYYPNSTVVSAALWCASFDVLARAETARRLWLGGLLLGMACWVRFDAVVMLPMVPFILRPAERGAALRKAAQVVGVAAIVSLVAVYASGSGLGVILQSFWSHASHMRDWPLSLKSYLAFFSMLTLFLIGVGLWETMRQRRWRVLGLLLAGGLPLQLLLAGSVTTPKYLLYLVPPLTVVMAQAASFLARCGRVPKRLVGGAAALLFAMQYLVGVQIEYTHGFHPRPVPTLTTLVHWPVKTPAVAGVSLVVGAGATITTHDSIRLSSGLWFANLTWRHYKQQAQDVSQALTGFLNQVDRREIGVFVGSFTEARLLACRALYRDGYVLAENLGRANTSVWRKGDRTVRVLQGDIGLSQARSILATETIVVLEVWDQELRRKMQRCAPSAERLAGNERSAHAAYVVRDPAREGPPPGEKTHGTRNGDESMKASRRDFLKAPGASGPSAGPTTGDRGVRRGGLSPTALP